MPPTGGIPGIARMPVVTNLKNFSLGTALVLGITLTGCKQELPKKVDDPPVFGKVQELRTTASEKQLMYQGGQDPSKLNWGSATSYYVRLDDVWYPIQWDEVSKFKQLKVGDSVNLHPSEFISCVGENDIKPTCHRLMKIFKSDRRIAPLQVVP